MTLMGFQSRAGGLSDSGVTADTADPVAIVCMRHTAGDSAADTGLTGTCFVHVGCFVLQEAAS
ncbi:MAG: hypothetical protein ACTSU0_12050, partial [Alphaproteobacteria bacterium]